MKAIMKKYIFTMLAVVFLIVLTDPISSRAAEARDEEEKLVSMAQNSGDYQLDVRIRLPKEEASSIKTFMLQLKISGEVRNPSFAFAGSIAGNQEIVVREWTYSYDEAVRKGIFSIYVSGRINLFRKPGEFIDLGQLKLLSGDEYKKDAPPQIEVTVGDYQIVNTFRQETVDFDYGNACDSLILVYQETDSELADVLKEAEGYVGEGSVLDGKLFAGIRAYTDLQNAYRKALSVDQKNRAAAGQAAKELKTAIERIRPIYGLLHILMEANAAIEGYGRVDCGELIRRFQEALEYLEKNDDPSVEEIETKSRFLQFEIVVAQLRTAVIKSQLSREEEGKYTEGNLAAWKKAMDSAVFLLGRRDTVQLDDIVGLKDEAAVIVDELNTAYAGLIDVTSLRELLRQAEAMIAEKGKYTEKSMVSLKTARDQAVAFLGLKTVITRDSIYNDKGEMVQIGYHTMEARLSDAIGKMQERVKTLQARPQQPASAAGTGSGEVTGPSEENPGGQNLEASEHPVHNGGYEEIDVTIYDPHRSEMGFILLTLAATAAGILVITTVLLCHRSWKKKRK